MGHELSRRHFLIASLAVPAAAATAGAASAAVQVDEHLLFQEASTAYGVPASVLAAVSYSQTRWQDHEGAPSASAGYGPMHLIDGEAAQAERARAGKEDSPTLDTLGQAATLTGLSKDQLRTDPGSNIRGAAAVLAAHQSTLGHAGGATSAAGQWYGAVATTSGMATAPSQLAFADHVIDTLRNGATVDLADGSQLTLARSTVSAPEDQRAPLAKRASESEARGRGRGPVDAPRSLGVEWIPAPYEQYGPGAGDYGNHDLAKRPGAPAIKYIVIHDTEGSYQGTLNMVQDPTYVSWQYTLRSSDGHIAQHVRPENVAWHAGNWYINGHSIGLEHEGYAAQGAPWYSDPMYRTSAHLVRYLTERYNIPRDRGHIIGHDQVPGTITPNIPGMHWDPGPFWDWERYFNLLEAPLSRGTELRAPVAGEVVRILPGFVGNKQPVTGCVAGQPNSCGDKDTNFVTLRLTASDTGTLVNDIGLHQKGQPASTEVSDISARATAGLEFVVAEVQGDWTAIWYLSQKAWFKNPASRRTARVVTAPTRKAAAKGSTPVATYGRCYPEPAAYADPADVQAISPLLYKIPAGQEYFVMDADPVTDYYKAQTFSLDTPNDHIDIVGQIKYVQISYGHRVAFVNAADVTLS